MLSEEFSGKIKGEHKFLQCSKADLDYVHGQKSLPSQQITSNKNWRQTRNGKVEKRKDEFRVRIELNQTPLKSLFQQSAEKTVTTDASTSGLGTDFSKENSNNELKPTSSASR